MLPNLLHMTMAAATALLSGPAAAAARATVPRRQVPDRPVLQPWPLQPYKPIPAPGERTNKTCFVDAGQGADPTDDAPAILAALESCNGGGTVVLDGEYTVCAPLDLRFLGGVDVALTGTVGFCDDVDRWLGSAFQLGFQNQSTFWLVGGEDVHLYGGGTLDGRGQAWYDRFAVNETLQRPILLTTDGLRGGSITGIKMRNSPNWHTLIANSSDVLVSDIDIYSRSASANEAKNLDAWDTYRSDNVVIQSSRADHDDDCVSFKPNSTNVLVQNLACNSSHGVSVGSLGQYPGVVDLAENLYVYNVSLTNASDSARIKVWPGADTDYQPGLGGGGGEGRVRNVTYERFYVGGNDAAVRIDQCYGEKNLSRCEEFPSKMVIEDVVFKDFWGFVSAKYDPVVGSLVCSIPESCQNIRAENISIENPSGEEARWECRNVDESLLGGLNGAGCVEV